MNLTIKEDIQADIRKSLSEERVEGAERKILEKMDQIKNQKTRQGQSPAKNGRWVNYYSRRYARQEKGRTTPVTLRKDGTNQRARNTIEDTHVVKSGKWSELRFRNREAGRIHWVNHTGYYDGNVKPRQIYPESDNQVPESLDEFAENAVYRILR